MVIVTQKRWNSGDFGTHFGFVTLSGSALRRTQKDLGGTCRAKSGVFDLQIGGDGVFWGVFFTPVVFVN